MIKKTNTTVNTSAKEIFAIKEQQLIIEYSLLRMKQYPLPDDPEKRQKILRAIQGIEGASKRISDLLTAWVDPLSIYSQKPMSQCQVPIKNRIADEVKMPVSELSASTTKTNELVMKKEEDIIQVKKEEVIQVKLEALSKDET